MKNTFFSALLLTAALISSPVCGQKAVTSGAVVVETSPGETLQMVSPAGETVQVVSLPGEEEVLVAPASEEIVEVAPAPGTAAIVSVPEDETAVVTPKVSATGQVVPHVKAKKKHHHHSAAPVGQASDLLNIFGRLKDIVVGKGSHAGKHGTYVDILLAHPHMASFQEAPLRAVGPHLSTPLVADSINLAPHNFMLAFGARGLTFIATVKPQKVEVLGPSTLRVWIDSHHLSLAEKQAQLAELHRFKTAFHHHNKHEKEADHNCGGALFASYSPVPGAHDGKVAPRKRDTFFAFSSGGVTFSSSGPAGETGHFVTFHNMDKVIALSDTGKQTPFTDGELEALIGKGGHPFQPNGVFVLNKNGKEIPIILAFDTAHLDPKTHDVTFTVTFLESHDTPGSDLIPEEFNSPTPVHYDHPTGLWLDWGDVHIDKA